jgi:hypothetical protein
MPFRKGFQKWFVITTFAMDAYLKAPMGICSRSIPTICQHWFCKSTLSQSFVMPLFVVYVF